MNFLQRLYQSLFVQTAQRSAIVNRLEVQPIVRRSQSVEQWRTAIQQAEGLGQQRAALYDLYDEALLDGFLSACLEKRRLALQMTALQFVGADGLPDFQVSQLVERSFFGDLVRHILDARFYGHSLIELNWASSTEGETILIPRRHVKPRHQLVTVRAYDTEGYSYQKNDQKGAFSQNVLSVGDAEDLGILARCCPYIIWKRANLGNWTDYAELFGIPTIFARYQNDTTRQVLEAALSQLGSRGRLIAPADADIEYHDANTGSGWQVFQELREAMNQEIAVTILGNTMTTTEAKHSGYAQAKIQAKEQAQLRQDDRKYVERVLNEQLTPLLIQQNFFRDKDAIFGKWQFEEEE